MLTCGTLFYICRFDVVSGTRRASVINTKSFGGQCRTIYSGVHNAIYRLPLSTIQYSFMVGHFGNTRSKLILKYPLVTLYFKGTLWSYP